MASPATSSTQASGSGSKKEEAIGEMLNRLGIEDDELDDLVFEEEESAPKQGIKWMALAKVHTANNFSPITFENHMRNAWSPAQPIEFNHLEGSLFTIQCFCLGDWLKITEGGPWLFRQNIVCIEEYDGLGNPDTIDLNFFDTWLQIHKLPVGYRNFALIKNLTEKKVGAVLKVETNVQGMGNFVRVRIRLDVRKTLARFVSIVRGGQREIYKIQYEKMPRFCGACGILGHSHLECGTGEYEEDKLKWGDFLKADWETWFGRGTTNFRGGGIRGGRSGRSGEGVGARGGRDIANSLVPWRHNARRNPGDDSQEADLLDTATSPGKVKDMELDKTDLTNPATKRSLEMGGLRTEFENGTTVNVNENKGQAAMIAEGNLNNGLNNENNEKDRNKRTKKDGANSSSLGSAESHEGSVRSQ
ncbi:hypothetical protein QYE76_003626 [Lolium multiflorum]|uniref:Zinc knuckle CX2CX4HX4C domain-containing protein n=1 Tax=Lolium multiflorum TaxID=4521 RepID=A0AAD8W1R9_LOLMU|nr:hypothetical protein QYE76_003626 [Lolium multiflorum]